MRDPSPRWAPVVASAAFVLLLCGAPGPVEPQPSDPAATDTVSGTIHDVDATAHTLELLTGTGHALRLETMKVAADCEIHADGASASLADLERGQIVRIRYTGADDERLAHAIETIAEEAPGGER
jgi:hypothetical protein